MEAERSVINAYRNQATMKDYPGRMSALFFTPGCNFRCGFCHNSGLFDATKTYSWDELREICKKFRRQWVGAITVTGGEPTIHRTLPETLRFLKRQGFAVKLDSNGSNPEMLEELMETVDFVAMDIKCSLEGYPALTGYSHVENLQRSIRLIMEKAKDYEFRTTVMEYLHTDEELLACVHLIEGAKKYALQAFIPHEDLPSEVLRTAERTRPSFLQHAADVVRPFVQNLEVRGV